MAPGGRAPAAGPRLAPRHVVSSQQCPVSPVHAQRCSAGAAPTPPSTITAPSSSPAAAPRPASPPRPRPRSGRWRRGTAWTGTACASPTTRSAPRIRSDVIFFFSFTFGVDIVK